MIPANIFPFLKLMYDILVVKKKGEKSSDSKTIKSN